jgi:hypothetical protein
MKRASLLAISLLATACSGPVGPAGAPGDQGPPGSATGSVAPSILDGVVIRHEAADDTAGKNGVLHVRARAVQVGTVIASVDEDADITQSGLGGLDSGTPATADTWYGVLVVTTGGASGHAMLTANPASPTLPTGHQARRIGWARWTFGASPKFLCYRQVGREVTFLPDAGIASRTILSGRDVKTAELADGQATGGAGTEKDVALLVPPDVFSIRVRTTVVEPAGGSNADVFWGPTVTDWEPLASCANSATVGSDTRCTMETRIELRDSDRRLFYGMSETGTGAITYTVVLAGYTDEGA